MRGALRFVIVTPGAWVRSTLQKGRIRPEVGQSYPNKIFPPEGSRIYSRPRDTAIRFLIDPVPISGGTLPISMHMHGLTVRT